MNRCPDCNLDLDKFGIRHRCGGHGGRVVGEKLTRLEKEKAIRTPAPKLVGLALDAGSAVSGTPVAVATMLPRLARVPPGTAKPERSVADELALLRAEIEAMRAAIVKLTESRSG
jgi:hypothetical protein